MQFSKGLAFLTKMPSTIVCDNQTYDWVTTQRYLEVRTPFLLVGKKEVEHFLVMAFDLAAQYQGIVSHS
ncbi:hypothetical protein [Persicobacter diffluens]|uniref:Uncharacterized protein n=1 Tax=Persicobacter diffluens TaxID=981 RepID=A0AAN5AJJ8_9BACT|nr:hypothetical protein PEDI_14940 [Persicobacter diffluens]